MQKVIHDHRLFDKKLAGGAILDVGLYPVSLSRMLAGAAVGKKFINPISLTGKATIGETGVDELASATLTFENDIIAEVSTAIMLNMDNNAVIEGEIGKVIIDDPWMPGKDGGPYNTKIRVIKNGKEEIEEFKGPEHLFFFEAELASQTISKQRTEVEKFKGRLKEQELDYKNKNSLAANKLGNAVKLESEKLRLRGQPQKKQ